MKSTQASKIYNHPKNRNRKKNWCTIACQEEEEEEDEDRKPFFFFKMLFFSMSSSLACNPSHEKKSHYAKTHQFSRE
jgi:hypothetical protein